MITDLYLGRIEQPSRSFIYIAAKAAGAPSTNESFVTGRLLAFETLMELYIYHVICPFRGCGRYQQ